MVLTYADASGAPGKATAESNIVEARFVDIVRGERVVQAVDFVSDDPAYAGTMTMTWEVTAAGAGTRVDIVGAHRQNDSVPLSANLSTSRRGTCVNAQLPSGLRAKSARPLTVPEKLPVASANCPVPPVTRKLSCCVPLNKQLCSATASASSARPSGRSAASRRWPR